MRKTDGLVAIVLLTCSLSISNAFIGVQSHNMYGCAVEKRQYVLINRLHLPKIILQLEATNSDDGVDEDESWGTSTANITPVKSGEIIIEDYQDGVLEKISKVNEPKRDLFIPIFTLVSLVGFVGAYAYESFRLYANGELYLPWNN